MSSEQLGEGYVINWSVGLADLANGSLCTRAIAVTLDHDRRLLQSIAVHRTTDLGRRDSSDTDLGGKHWAWRRIRSLTSLIVLLYRTECIALIRPVIRLHPGPEFSGSSRAGLTGRFVLIFHAVISNLRLDYLILAVITVTTGRADVFVVGYRIKWVSYMIHTLPWDVWCQDDAWGGGWVRVDLACVGQ